MCYWIKDLLKKEKIYKFTLACQKYLGSISGLVYVAVADSRNMNIFTASSTLHNGHVFIMQLRELCIFQAFLTTVPSYNTLNYQIYRLKKDEEYFKKIAYPLKYLRYEKNVLHNGYHQYERLRVEIHFFSFWCLPSTIIKIIGSIEFVPRHL